MGLFALQKTLTSMQNVYFGTLLQINSRSLHPSLSSLNHVNYMDPIVNFNGFGYDHVKDDYKVIRWLYFYDNAGVDELRREYLDVEPMWEIYNLRCNSWRKLDIKMPCSGSNEKLYVNGMCHWWSLNDDNNYSNAEPRLVSFDLCNEVFLTTPLPSDMVDRYDICHLTFLNGSIGFIMYDETTTFNIRILGELGVKESWDKIFTVELLPYIERPIGVGKKGDIFFRKDDDELVSSDLSIQMIKELDAKGCECWCYIAIYKDSLLPIEGLLTI
ncbi:putative F-box associated interaction domain-containing protein [Medicago truncatula]|uniref:F-box protein interaction domain protein n=2 Tax=Medicago truncatula TaxID=3880 RepID=A0A072U4Y2_MEDTR|nr:F-box protein interaction domain protein [Medicago truncatula]RHN49686.1 putative F-box associated interaction domain-containing protein [Medicago truncatula]